MKSSELLFLLRNPSLPTVRPVSLENATKKVSTTGHTTPSPGASTLDRVRRRLAMRARTGPWSRSELQAVALLLNDRKLREAGHDVLAAHAPHLGSGALAIALAWTPSNALRAEAARRAQAGRLRGPRWLRMQTSASLTSRERMLEPLLPALDPRLAIPDVVAPLELQLQQPFARKLVQHWLRSHGARHLWAHALANADWALPLASDWSLARDVLDALLVRAAEDDPALRRPLTVHMLEGLRDAYGGWAERSVQKDRWSRHDERTQKLARRYKVGRHLDRFFSELHGDPDRLAYWRRWIDQIDDAAIYERIHAFSMEIGDHVVVEFGQVGNAAYVYRTPDWLRYRPEQARQPADVKSRAQAVARIMHRAGWQPEADHTVTALTGRTPRG